MNTSIRKIPHAISRDWGKARSRRPHRRDAIVDSFAGFNWLLEEYLHVDHGWQSSGGVDVRG